MGYTYVYWDSFAVSSDDSSPHSGWCTGVMPPPPTPVPLTVVNRRGSILRFIASSTTRRTYTTQKNTCFYLPGMYERQAHQPRNFETLGPVASFPRNAANATISFNNWCCQFDSKQHCIGGVCGGGEHLTINSCWLCCCCCRGAPLLRCSMEIASQFPSPPPAFPHDRKHPDPISRAELNNRHWYLQPIIVSLLKF